MSSSHTCRLTATQRKLSECSKCLRIILEILNENNNGNLKDDEEIYFKRTDWVTVKEKIKQYEMKIDSIGRAAMLLQTVRKRTGRLVKKRYKKNHWGLRGTRSHCDSDRERVKGKR